MLVPRARARECRVLQAFGVSGSNGLRFGFRMLRLTAACCGDDETLLGARAPEAVKHGNMRGTSNDDQQERGRV